MSTNNYSGFPAAFVSAGPTTLNLKQMEAYGAKPGSRKSIVTPAGALDRGAVMENFADSSKGFSTRDLTTLLGSVSPTVGLYCTGGSTFRFQKRTTGASFASSTNHITITSTLGFLKLDAIRASQDDDKGAVAQCSYLPLFDGTNDPLVQTNSVDFDAVNAPAYVSAFFLGPVYLGSSPIPGVVESMVDFGTEFRTVRSAGEVYASQGSIVARNPVAAFRILDISQVKATITRLFGNAYGSAIKIYYRKGAPGASRVADATTEHCKITFSTGDWTIDDISVSENQDGSANIIVTPTGTIAVSVASAIP